MASAGKRCTADAAISAFEADASSAEEASGRRYSFLGWVPSVLRSETGWASEIPASVVETGMRVKRTFASWAWWQAWG
jgi:hypothetical protein